jgi:hypothetical protein
MIKRSKEFCFINPLSKIVENQLKCLVFFKKTLLIIFNCFFEFVENVKSDLKMIKNVVN